MAWDRLATLAVVIAVGSAAIACDDRVDAPDRAPDQRVGSANEELAGVWRPRGVVPVEDALSRWRLVFDEDGTWHGVDGCNPRQGVFSLSEDGGFEGGGTPGSFEGGAGCVSQQLDYYGIFAHTTHVEVREGRAEFLDTEDRILLTLVRQR